MFERLLAFVLALFSLASPVHARPVLDVNAVKLVSCGEATGSGALIGRRRLLTAWHVAGRGGCSVDGKPARVVRRDERSDWAVLEADIRGPRLRVSCRGFRPGRYYLAGGHAFGARLMVQGLRYGGGRGRIHELKDGRPQARGDDFPLLDGLAFPGMSGGPVVDLEGRLVGIVNGSNVMSTPHPLLASALLRDLRATALCRR